jgi:hypothetical protein
VVFAFLVGAFSTLLMAPQVDEWGTKVGLLSSLVVVCAARPILDRLVPEPRSAADDLRAFGSRLATGGKTGVGVLGKAARVGVIALVFLGLGAGIVVAGSPARGAVAANTAEVLDRVPHEVDPSTFPAITIDQDVSDWNHGIEGDGARAIVLTLAENLELENQALLRRDASILPAVDHGDRLTEMQGQLSDAGAAGHVVARHYHFDRLTMRLIEPFGVQSGLSLGLDARGTVTEETYDAAGNLVGSRDVPLAQTFVMRRATGDRWLNIGVLPAGQGS